MLRRLLRSVTVALLVVAAAPAWAQDHLPKPADYFYLSTDLTVDISAGATASEGSPLTVTVVSTSNFSDTGNDQLMICDLRNQTCELMRYSSKTSTTFSVVERGMSGEGAIAHDADDPLVVVTSGPNGYTLRAIIDDLVGTKSIAVGDSPYTALVTDRTIRIDSSGGAVTVNLPPAGDVQGKRFLFKAEDETNTITLDGDGSETIDGSATNTDLAAADDWIEIESDGSGWIIVGSTGGGISALVDDTTPQLGGDLDLNGNVITGLEIGTDVQAWDIDLDTIAGLTVAVGDVLIGGTGPAWTNLAAGTSGYVLTSNGAGVAPSWQAGGGGDTISEGDSNVEVIDAGTGQVDIDLDATALFRFVTESSGRGGFYIGGAGTLGQTGIYRATGTNYNLYFKGNGSTYWSGGPSGLSWEAGGSFDFRVGSEDRFKLTDDGDTADQDDQFQHHCALRATAADNDSCEALSVYMDVDDGPTKMAAWDLVATDKDTTTEDAKWVARTMSAGSLADGAELYVSGGNPIINLSSGGYLYTGNISTPGSHQTLIINSLSTGGELKLQKNSSDVLRLDYSGGPTIGFFGSVPAARSTGWTTTSVSSDTTLDCTSMTGDAATLCDVLGTLLQALGDTSGYGLIDDS